MTNPSVDALGKPSGPAQTWEQKATSAEEVLAALRNSPPNPADFTGPNGTNKEGLTFGDARAIWMEDVTMAATTVATLRDLSYDMVELPDGRTIGIGDLPPELRTALEQANESRYSDLVNNYNLNAYRTQAETRQADFNNQVTQFDQKRGLDQDNQSRAESRLGRQLDGMAESRARADVVTQSLLDAAPYASPSGQTSFSGTDIGSPAASWMSRLGLDPNSPLLNFTGTQEIDPEGLISKYDQGMGVSGPLESIPDSLLGMGDVPQLPQFGSAPSLIPPSQPMPFSQPTEPMGNYQLPNQSILDLLRGALTPTQTQGFQHFQGQNVVTQPQQGSSGSLLDSILGSINKASIPGSLGSSLLDRLR